MSSDGAAVQFIAPGTETCRWTGTFRAREADAQVPERAARLRALDAVNKVAAEGDALLRFTEPEATKRELRFETP